MLWVSQNQTRGQCWGHQQGPRQRRARRQVSSKYKYCIIRLSFMLWVSQNQTRRQCWGHQQGPRQRRARRQVSSKYKYYQINIYVVGIPKPDKRAVHAGDINRAQGNGGQDGRLVQNISTVLSDYHLCCGYPKTRQEGSAGDINRAQGNGEQDGRLVQNISIIRLSFMLWVSQNQTRG